MIAYCPDCDSIKPTRFSQSGTVRILTCEKCGTERRIDTSQGATPGGPSEMGYALTCAEKEREAVLYRRNQGSVREAEQAHADAVRDGLIREGKT